MGDIFVSYAREDRDFAKEMAASLEEEGWSVWWDRSIPTGRRYHKVIEEALAAARCVIVVWSEHSVGSDWVRAEAGEGMARNVLAPVAIDAAQPPLVFRQLQTADLSGWTGDNSAEDFRRLVGDIRSIAPPTPESEPGSGPEPTPPAPTPGPTRPWLRWVVAAAGAIALLAAAWVGYRAFNRSLSPPTATLDVAPKKIRAGEEAVLTWTTERARRVEISGLGRVQKEGRRPVKPDATTRYTLIAHGAKVLTEESAVLEVVARRNPDPQPTREPVGVVRVLDRPGGQLMSHGFFTPQGLIIAFAPSDDKREYALSWLQGSERRSGRARVVKQRDDRGPVPFLALMKLVDGLVEAPKPVLRNARSLERGEKIERYLSVTERTPGKVQGYKVGFDRIPDVRFDALLTTDISSGGEAGAPVLDASDRLVGVMVGGGSPGSNLSVSVPIELVKRVFQDAF